MPVTASTSGQPVHGDRHWGGTATRWRWSPLGELAGGLAGPAGAHRHEVQVVPPGGGGRARVGTGVFALGTQIEVVPLRLAATVPEPSWWWRLVHN